MPLDPNEIAILEDIQKKVTAHNGQLDRHSKVLVELTTTIKDKERFCDERASGCAARMTEISAGGRMSRNTRLTIVITGVTIVLGLVTTVVLSVVGII